MAGETNSAVGTLRDLLKVMLMKEHPDILGAMTTSLRLYCYTGNETDIVRAASLAQCLQADMLHAVATEEAPPLPSESKIDEIDRNARAYGWEIGRGRQLSTRIETSDDNPFLSADWRNLVHAESGATAGTEG